MLSLNLIGNIFLIAVLGTKWFGFPKSIRRQYTTILILSLSLLPSCQPELVEKRTILFLGHPYNWRTENTIDPRLEHLPLSAYDGIWLGGDVCARSSKAAATLRYLDSLFQLASSSTH